MVGQELQGGIQFVDIDVGGFEKICNLVDQAYFLGGVAAFSSALTDVDQLGLFLALEDQEVIVADLSDVEVGHDRDDRDLVVQLQGHFHKGLQVDEVGGLDDDGRHVVVGELHLQHGAQGGAHGGQLLQRRGREEDEVQVFRGGAVERDVVVHGVVDAVEGVSLVAELVRRPRVRGGLGVLDRRRGGRVQDGGRGDGGQLDRLRGVQPPVVEGDVGVAADR